MQFDNTTPSSYCSAILGSLGMNNYRSVLLSLLNSNAYTYYYYSNFASSILDALIYWPSASYNKTFIYNLTAKANVVHFADYPAKKLVNTGSRIYGYKFTMTIPRGRTLRITPKPNTPTTSTSRSTFRIDGDLCIQDGGTLYVDGNLTVSNPGNPGTDLKKPCGRVILGEGSTLVVKGNFTCAGSPTVGSVYVSSPRDYRNGRGKIKHITSAILCSGNVTIPYSICPGIYLDKLAYNGTSFSSYMEKLSQNAPTLAKGAGPFHDRKEEKYRTDNGRNPNNAPYFAARPSTWLVYLSGAKYITTFGSILGYSYTWHVDPSDGYSVNRFVNGVTYNVYNINTKIFEVISKSYRVYFNAFLGEYLYTSTEWWKKMLGYEELLPILPKLTLYYTDPKESDPVISRLNSISVTAADLNNLTDYCAYFLGGALSSGATVPSTVNDALFTTINNVVFTGIPSLVTALRNINTRYTVSSFNSNFYYSTTYFSNLLDLITNNPTSIDNRANAFLTSAPNFKTQIDDVYDRLYGTTFDASYMSLTKYINNSLIKRKNLIFNETGGVLVYGGYLYLGNNGSATTMSGLFIASNNIYFYSPAAYPIRIVGCLISLNRDIGSTTLGNCIFRYYPYFTKASLYIPKKIAGTGYSANLANLNISTVSTASGDIYKSNYVTSPSTDKAPRDIGVNVCHITSEGWDW